MASLSLNNSSVLSELHSVYKFKYPFQFPSRCNVPKCECILVSFEHLADHEEEHAKTGKHICYVCHCTFSSAQALRIHLNTQYVKAAIHECPCGSKYADPSRKSRCAKAHTTIYRCPDQGCDYRNSRKELVVRHLKVGKAQGHKRATPTTPLEEIRFDLGRPKHLPGREPGELRPCTEEVLYKLASMELMCKQYCRRRLENLAEHFTSVGREALAEETWNKATGFRDNLEGSRRTSPRRSSSGDSGSSLGNDAIACDTPAGEYYPGTQSYFSTTHESPRENIGLPFDFFGDNNPLVANALGSFDPAPEGEWSNPIQHTLNSQQSMASEELEAMASQFQVHSGGDPSDIILADIAAGAHPSWFEGAAMLNYYGNPNVGETASRAQHGVAFDQGAIQHVHLPEFYMHRA